MRAAVEEHFAIFPDCSAFDDGAFFMYFGCNAPGGEDFEVAREDAIGAAGYKRSFTFIYRLISKAMFGLWRA